MRHSGASNVVLTLTVEHGCVALDVRDDGSGLPEDRVAGVGLASMRERAAEVGGSVEVGSNPPHGTRVTARLPLAVAPVTGLPVPRASS